MPRESQHEPDPAAPDTPDTPDAPGAPRLAIRRHTDRCFHEVEEVVYDGPAGAGPAHDECVGRELPGTGVRGYIIDGVMIDADDVAEFRTIPADGPGPKCMDANDPRQG